jgi:hypothetical protein
MKYQLYKKADNEDAGEALALIGHHESNVIDEFEVYLITNGDPVKVNVFKDKGIKIYGEGRPLWSEVTWEKNGKWKVLQTTVNLDELATKINADPSPAAVDELVSLFSQD